MQDVTSRDIMEATGIRSAVTLIRWHKARLIPEPEVKVHPGGRGTMSYWPEWVLKRCLRIKQLQNDGKSLDQIRDVLGTNWEEDAKKYRRPYRFVEASRQIERELASMNLQETLLGHLRKWSGDLKLRIDSFDSPLLESDVMDKAVAMLEQGLNPVLIIHRNKILLTVDLAVIDYLQDVREMSEAIHVIPIIREIVAFLKNSENLSPEPTVRAEMGVKRVVDGKTEGLTFHPVGEWEFELSRSARRKKRSS